MPTFVLLLFVLGARFVIGLIRGAGGLILVPARTAGAIAPYVRRPQWVLAAGLVGTLLLAGTAVAFVAAFVQ